MAMWERSKPIIIGVAAYLVSWGFFAGVANMSPQEGEGSVRLLWVVAGFTSWLVAPLLVGATVYALHPAKPRRDAFLAGFLAPLVMMLFFAVLAVRFPTASMVFGAVISWTINGALAVAGVWLGSVVDEWVGKWPSPPPTFRQLLYQRPREIGKTELLSALAARLWLVAGSYIMGLGACAVLKSTLVLCFLALLMPLNALNGFSDSAPHWIHLVMGPIAGGFVAARYGGLRSLVGGGGIGLLGASMGLATWSDMYPPMSVPSLPIQIGFVLLGAVLGVAGIVVGWRMAINATDDVGSLFTPDASAPTAEPSGPKFTRRPQAIVALVGVIAIALWVVFAINSAPLGGRLYETPELTGPATVISGDTLKVGGKEIQLAFIRAPSLEETCKWRTKKWPCGQASARKLEDLIGTEAVTCRTETGSSIRLDRYICDLNRDRHGEGWINQRMVAEGYAFAANKDYLNDFLMKEIRKLESEAKAARRGIWVDPTIRSRM